MAGVPDAPRPGRVRRLSPGRALYAARAGWAGEPPALCLERDVGIILGGPYNSGILASGPVEGATYDYKPAPPGILERVGRIQALCETHGVRLAAAALQFVLAHPAVKTVIPGAASAAEVRENVGLLGASVPPGLWSDLKTAGLVRDDAPVPAP